MQSFKSLFMGAWLSYLQATLAAESLPGSSTYVISAGFPTSAYSSYYVPASPTQEPVPVIFDPVFNTSYPFNLTDPKNLPKVDTDPVFYPPAVADLDNATAQAFVANAITQIKEIISGTGGISGNCSKCVAALNIGKIVAQVTPENVPDALVALCESTGFASNTSCVGTYSAGSFGAIWTQILALADVSGLDGQYICNSLSRNFCPAPTTSPLNTAGLFPKPKPANAAAPKASGERVKVLHLSDFHLDPRYFASAEANCTSGLCCRTNVHGTVQGQISFPAPLYGAFRCDTPYDLALGALSAIGPLTGTSKDDPLGQPYDFSSLSLTFHV